MNSAIPTRAAQLVALPLPIEAGSKQGYLTQIHRHNSPLTELAKQCAHDPVLSTRVLQAVNRRRKSQIQDIAHIGIAVGLLGVGSLNQLIGEIPTIEARLTGEQAQRHYRRLLLRTAHAAWQAYDWGRQIGDPAPIELQQATLACQIAELALCVEDPGRYLAYLRAIEFEQADPQSAGQRHLGAPLAELGQAVVMQPDFFPETVRFILDPQHRDHYRAQLVRHADEYARQAERGWFGEALTACLTEIAELLNQPLAKVAQDAYQTALNVARAHPDRHSPPAAAFLPLLPAAAMPLLEPAIDNPPEAPKVSAKQPSSTQETTQETMAANVEDLSAEIRNLTASANVLRTLAFGLRNSLHLPRVVLLIPHDGTLRARLALGVANDEPIQQFAIKLADCLLCEQLLIQFRGLWVTAAHYALYRDRIPPELIRALASEEFFIQSLRIGKRPIALLIADCYGEPLDQTQVNGLHRLCRTANETLAVLPRPSP